MLPTAMVLTIHGYALMSICGMAVKPRHATGYTTGVMMKAVHITILLAIIVRWAVNVVPNLQYHYALLPGT